MSEMHYFYQVVPVQFTVSEVQKEEILKKYPPPTFSAKRDGFNLQVEETGNFIQVVALLNDYQIYYTKQNKPFLRLQFSHPSGMIQGVVWDNNGQVASFEKILKQHSVFTIEGTVHEFNEEKSVTITSLKPYEDEVNPFALLPYTKESLTALTVELFAYLYELSSPYKDIVLAAMDQFWSDFCKSPAAIHYHHNYLGGLLKHTVGLMRLTRYILHFEKNHYQAIIKLIHVVEKAYKKELWDHLQETDAKRLVWKDTIDHLYLMFERAMAFKEDEPKYDLLMTSILFHDLGKLLEYDYIGASNDAFQFLFPTTTNQSLKDRQQAGISMDPLGQRIGHIPYGFLLLAKIVEKENIVLSIDDFHEISHCILCHHGLPEWGSPLRAPQTIEGYIIHIVDYLDSRYESVITMKS